MARTRTTIRRIDPWSILKFGFVANLVLLGIQLLAGAIVWYVVQRLELIQTVCELAGTVGFEECGVDGGALFDTFLVLGLLGVVIQTGILVFLTFLANLIFDLTGGIVLTLEDDRGPAATGARSAAGARGGATSGAKQPKLPGADATGRIPNPPASGGASSATTTTTTIPEQGREWPGDRMSRGPGTDGGSSSGDDDLFSGR